MTTPVTFDTLPPDINRRIVEEVEESASDLRLVSRSWDDAVRGHFASRTSRITAERVYLFAGVESRIPFASSDAERAELRAEGKERVHMYAIILDRHEERVGVGKWLTVDREYEGGAVEVTCEPLPIDALNIRPVKLRDALKKTCKYVTCIVILVVFLLLTTLEITIPNTTVVPWYFKLIPIPIGALVILFIFWRATRNGAAEKKRRARLTKFFSMISQIDTLVMENFGHTYRGNLDTALQTLSEDTGITRLVVRDDFDSDLQERIIDLCRKHRIRQVLITACNCKMDLFQNFVRTLAGMDVIFDVYEERVWSNQEPIFFAEPREFFTEMAENLNREDISMRMTTTHDASFINAGYPDGVRAHIRCAKLAESDEQELAPVLIERGFNERQHRFV